MDFHPGTLPTLIAVAIILGPQFFLSEGSISSKLTHYPPSVRYATSLINGGVTRKVKHYFKWTVSRLYVQVKRVRPAQLPRSGLLAR